MWFIWFVLLFLFWTKCLGTYFNLFYDDDFLDDSDAEEEVEHNFVEDSDEESNEPRSKEEPEPEPEPEPGEGIGTGQGKELKQYIPFTVQDAASKLKLEGKTQEKEESPIDEEEEKEQEEEEIVEETIENIEETLSFLDLPIEFDDYFLDFYVFDNKGRVLTHEACTKMKDYCAVFPRRCYLESDFLEKYIKTCIIISKTA